MHASAGLPVMRAAPIMRDVGEPRGRHGIGGERMALKNSHVPGALRATACGLLCLACAAATAVDVDMDPVPRFPLRKGDYLTFLVHLSGAKRTCGGTVNFRNVPDGIAAEPPEQTFALKPGEEKLLVFKVTCTAWGEPAVVRPEVRMDGGAEPVNFPERLKTTLVRDAKSLDKTPLDERGLLAYFSCGDLSPKEYHHFDRSMGNPRFWNEGIWYHAGGVKGRAVFGMNGRPYPRHRWSKFAYETLNNIYHRRGTICFWMRKSRRPTEIPYTPRFKGDPKSTWKLGPTAMRGHEGEGILGHIWSPQSIYVRWFLKKPRPWKPFKPGSNSFLGLRRYKAVEGLTDGFLEATYRAMRGKIYHVQAPYKWTDAWRHVALAWDAERAELAIYLDGERASGKLMCNGKPTADTVFHSAPWHVATFCNAGMSICCVGAEGGRSATDRDEYYVYNRALSPDEIKANMKKSMGSVPTPALAPGATSFHGTLAVEVRGLWYNATHRVTTDGTEPTEDSSEYAGPITLTKTTTLKVKSFLEGFRPSETASATFECLGPDRTKPKVIKVVALDPREVTVCFDEPVDLATAEQEGHYTVAGAAAKVAKLDRHGRCVLLTLAKPLAAGEQALAVEKVCDRAANVMDPSKATFRLRNLTGLVGWWSFDCLDGPWVKDLSANGIDGLGWSDLYEGLERVEGVRGRAVRLDGIDDLVDLTDYTDKARLRVNRNSPHNLDQGTMALWFKVDPKRIGWKKALFCKTYAYHAFVASGKLMRSKIDVNDGRWHHLAFVFEPGKGAAITIYLDGKPVIQSKKRFLRHDQNGLGLGVGGGGFGQPKFFGGWLDEVMLFNRPLDADAVGALHKTGGLPAEGG
jgi:hypothetical protein